MKRFKTPPSREEEARPAVKVPVDKLQEIIINHYKKLVFSGRGNAIPPLFIEDGQTKYDDDQMKVFFERDFITRLFMATTSINLQSIFLRTKFTDNHPKTSYLNSSRDFMKATFVTKNYTASKANCTELLSSCLQAFSDPSSTSKYYSFAITMASGLSNMAQNIDFEQGMVSNVTDLEEVNLARRKFCLLMHIIFSKIATYRFLVNEQGSNSYRISYCMAKTLKRSKMPVMFSFFSFCLQICLVGYVVAENITTGIDSYLVRNIPLALVTLLYGAILAYPSLVDGEKAKSFYKRVGNERGCSLRSLFLRLLPLMDFFVNQFLAIVLVASGFLVILTQESFIEAVLNTAALLFIADIDDSLPTLVGLDEKSIIENYLISQSLKEFEALVLSEEKYKKKGYSSDRFSTHQLRSLNEAIGVDFQDYHLTFNEEGPAKPESGMMFQPYQIRASSSSFAVEGCQIDPSNFITEHCLISEITWAYTHSETFNNLTKPRIGWLKIVKMCHDGEGERTMIVDQRKPNKIVITSREIGVTDKEGISISDNKHTIKGVFIITSFQMSNDIFRLRVCGSSSARNFLNAMEYYSLWDVTPGAEHMLKKEVRREKESMKQSKRWGKKKDKQKLKQNDLRKGYVEML